MGIDGLEKGDGGRNILNSFFELLEILSNPKDIPLKEIFTNKFMEKHTKFKTFNDILSNSNIDIDEDFYKSSESMEWEEFIKENTAFNSWDEMKKEAIGLWIKDKLL